MPLLTLEALPRLLGAYLAATGVFQLALAHVSPTHGKEHSEFLASVSLIGGIICTTCVLAGVGFHFGSGGSIPLVPVFVLTLVFVHLDAILICCVASVQDAAVEALLCVLLALVGLAAHVATDLWLLRLLALAVTSLATFAATVNALRMAWNAASSALRRVDAVSSVLADLCDVLAGVLFMSIVLWTSLIIYDRKSWEFTVTSTSTLIGVCLIDMCVFQLTKGEAPTLIHANRVLFGVLLVFLECVTMANTLSDSY